MAVALENNKIHQVNPTRAATNAVNGAAFADVIVTVTVSYPPHSGPFASPTGSAEVVVSKTYSTYFVALFGLDKITIAARAVAGMDDNTGHTGDA
jgi:hypothetical protein